MLRRPRPARGTSAGARPRGAGMAMRPSRRAYSSINLASRAALLACAHAAGSVSATPRLMTVRPTTTSQYQRPSPLGMTLNSRPASTKVRHTSARCRSCRSRCTRKLQGQGHSERGDLRHPSTFLARTACRPSHSPHSLSCPLSWGHVISPHGSALTPKARNRFCVGERTQGPGDSKPRASHPLVLLGGTPSRPVGGREHSGFRPPGVADRSHPVARYRYTSPARRFRASRRSGPPTEAAYLRRIFAARSANLLGSRSPPLASSMISFATVKVIGSLRSTKPSLRSTASYAVTSFAMSSGSNTEPYSLSTSDRIGTSNPRIAPHRKAKLGQF
jgi:hypothetical protein